MLVYDIESLPENLTMEDVTEIAQVHEVVLWSSKTKNGVKPSKPYFIKEVPDGFQIVKVETKTGQKLLKIVQNEGL